MLLSGEPSMNGREPPASSATIATHQPAADEHRRRARRAAVRGAAAARSARRQVGEAERGHDEERLAHLRQEGEADHRAGGDDPAGAGPSSARVRQ
jgi:hypothetical protein